MLNPAIDRRVVDCDAALGHHRFKIAVADRVSAVPAYGPKHDFAPKVATLEIAHPPNPSLQPTQPVHHLCAELCNRAVRTVQTSHNEIPGNPGDRIRLARKTTVLLIRGSTDGRILNITRGIPPVLYSNILLAENAGHRLLEPAFQAAIIECYEKRGVGNLFKMWKVDYEDRLGVYCNETYNHKIGGTNAGVPVGAVPGRRTTVSDAIPGRADRVVFQMCVASGGLHLGVPEQLADHREVLGPCARALEAKEWHGAGRTKTTHDSGWHKSRTLVTSKNWPPQYCARKMCIVVVWRTSGSTRKARRLRVPWIGIVYTSVGGQRHMLAVHHTTCRIGDLRRKWLGDPDSDLRKTLRELKAQRENTSRVGSPRSF